MITKTKQLYGCYFEMFKWINVYAEKIVVTAQKSWKRKKKS